MREMKNYGLEQFTNLYPLTKTLRFELIPVEGTEERIREHGILGSDQALAESYQKMKLTIDEFHRDFIDQSLANVNLKNLQRYFELFNADDERKKTKEYRTKLENVKKDLRKEIVSYFTSDKKYFDGIFGKELFKSHLPQWMEHSKKEEYFDEAFVSFTTYFSGYNENRKNMYTDEAKSTAIAYRMIDENLPKFVRNLQIFARIANSEISGFFPEMTKELEAHLISESHSLEGMFELDTYNALMTQKNIDAYNTIIGGYKEGERSVKGINGYINEYNQTHSKNRLPKMQRLYKQILSEKNSSSWLPDAFENAPDMLKCVKEFCESTLRLGEAASFLEEIELALKEIGTCEKNQVFLRNDASISSISNAIFGYYGVVREALEYYYETIIDPKYLERLNKAKNEKAAENIEKQRKKYVTETKYFSVEELQCAVDLYMKVDRPGTEDIKNRYFEGCITTYLSDNAALYTYKVKEAFENAKDLLNAEYDTTYRLTETDKGLLKQLLDALLNLLHFCKPLYVKNETELRVDEVFYSTFIPLYEQLQTVTILYDKVRNYATQKPFSTDKIKLNFGIKRNFLNGWVESKTEKSDNGTQYCGYLFRKKNGIGEYDYYLGVSANTKLFRYFNEVTPSEASEYERLNYYQPKSQTVYGSAYRGKRTYEDDKKALKDIIMRFVRQSDELEFYDSLLAYIETDGSTPSGCLSRIKNYSPKMYDDLLRDNAFQEANEAIILALKTTMYSMERLKGAKEVADQEYHVFTELNEAIDSLMNNNVYQYAPVRRDELESELRNKRKPLYMFKITNKDLAYADRVEKGKTGKPKGRDNLHTMYFKALMSAQQSVYDIGSGAIFFRPKSIERNVTHPAGIPIDSKNPNLKGKTNVFGYDLVKDRRYTEDKYQFHLSIVQNYTAGKIKSRAYNAKVCDYLRNNPDINIIGIDRGERNLLYISMIDRNGNIVRDENGKLLQYSLNSISGEYTDSEGNNVEFSTPYHTLLDVREEERKKSKQSWGSVGKIKDLKTGYMSQVVSHVTKLMVEYNAIVVMENLNRGFIGSRRKVDKQVYQNFERALIQKLNYLVFKDYPADALGGLYHALQLSDQFTSFRDLQKQSGFIFYIPAWNTSKIDPVTGFVNLLKPKCDTKERARDFFNRFNKIRYNPDRDWFEFDFDYANFLAGAGTLKSEWVVCTHGDCRYVYNRRLNNNKGGYEEVNVTAGIKELFARYGLTYIDGENLVSAIVGMNKNVFFAELIRYLKITLAMRYSNGDGGRDYILSPVADERGRFFNSEEAAANGDALPWDADANGAYNIARKGLLVLRNIDNSSTDSDWSTSVSNRQWLEFAQSFRQRND